MIKKNLLSIVVIVVTMVNVSAQKITRLNDIPDSSGAGIKRPLCGTINGYGYLYSPAKNDTALLYKYDAKTDIWFRLPNNPYHRRINFGSSFCLGSKFYLFGGSIQGPTKTNDSVFVFDVNTNKWSAFSIPPEVSRSNGISTTYNGKGYYGLSTDSSFFEFDPSTNIWTRKSSFPGIVRDNNALYFINQGKLYIGGGVSTGSSTIYYHDLWTYDFEKDVWSLVGNNSIIMGISLLGVGGFTINNKSYSALGRAEFYLFTEILEYPLNPFEVEFTGIGKGMPAKYGHGIMVIDNKAIIVGGVKQGDFYGCNEVYLFNPDTLSTGNSSIDQESQFLVYPNPASQKLHLKGLAHGNLSNLIISVFNSSGSLVISKQITDNEVQIADLPGGLYYYQINANTFQQSGRFIKTE